MRDSPEDVDIEESLFDFESSDDIFNLSEDDFSELNSFEFDDLGIDPSVPDYHNGRKTIRYVRNDITASINQADIFGGFSLFSHSRSIIVKLLDISSKGAFIACPEKIRINKKIRLTLVFDANKKFEIEAKVIRESTEARKLYGLKFESINNELGDYILETQTELIFK
ncbi:MAG: hypothetical protein GQ569_12155 [Methylococcaceae bacterium]|nr:hypothetical protein [Methylococcaceae bacterium]